MQHSCRRTGRRITSTGSRSRHRDTSCSRPCCCCSRKSRATATRWSRAFARSASATSIGPRCTARSRNSRRTGWCRSWSAESKAGQARRVYGLTEDGERALRTWMGVVKEERDALDRVLRRYLSSGTPEALLAEATAGWSAFDEHTVTTNGNGAAPRGRRRSRRRRHRPDSAPAHAKHPPTGCRVCSVSASRRTASAVLIEARSTVGPITFGAIGIVGWIETTVGDGALEPGEHTARTSRSRSNAWRRGTGSTTPSCCAGSTPAAIPWSRWISTR